MELQHIDILDKGYVELIDYMGSDNSIVSAARVSLLGESKGKDADEKLIHYLKKNHHDTPFEMVEFVFRVKCPLFIRSQWMRHRTFSYNEVSRRYTSEEIDFYYTDKLRHQAENNRQASSGIIENSEAIQYLIKKSTEECFSTYETLLANGVAREQARMVLPQNMYTIFYVKGNLRNWFHFLDLRNDEHAQYEMQLYAKAIEDIITPIVPIACEAWRYYK
jgi:thymidylate synthase (FAD)